MSPFELIEHRADIGLKLWADSLGELFESATRGMFHIISEEPPPGWDETHKLYMEAVDPANLLVDWLSELLYMLEIKNFWVTDPQIEITAEDGTHKLDAALKGLKFKGVCAGTEIKAVTYHMLEIRNTNKGYESEIYFDL